MIAHELAAAFGLLTRLPVWRLVPPRPDVDLARSDLARSVWAYPVVGAAIGLLAGAIDWTCLRIGLPPALAAFWTLAATMLITGGLHEDGLADTADGFGGGRTRERKLEIMRDSRIGTYGALALILSIALRGVAIAALAAPMPALIVAATLSRAALILVLATTGPARTDGLAAGLARIPPMAAACGLGFALLLTATLLPLQETALLAAAALVSALTMRVLARRQIGGHTGDVLGATALITECLLLSLLTL